MKLYLWSLIALSLIAVVDTQSQTVTANASQKIFGLVIHGGAGAPSKKDATPADEKLYHDKILEALDVGYAVLNTNGTAVDAVQAAVMVMENSGIFDAGKGSVFNSGGFCELDAAIMDGRTQAAGAVAALQHIKNPIVLARAVMDKSPHVMLAGDGAEKFARDQGFEMVPNTYFQTERRRKQWERLRLEHESSQTNKVTLADPEALGTVGCVALDKNGNLAAATSTGGTAYKLPGRVGDSPIIGAGTYAKNGTCAVSGTGAGEYYIRTVFAHNISTLMEYKGLSLEQASAEAMKDMEAIGGQGGCIGIDGKGHVIMKFDALAMYRGFKLSNGNSDIQLYGATH